ncbi:MAG: response regulator [Opitutaceae bacterium]
MKALIVEDEQYAREYITEVLSDEFNFDEIVLAEDGEQAWELYQQQPFSLIVLDLILPKLDGLKLADRIMDIGRGQRILAMSAECDDYTVRQVTRSGILGFIRKKELSREVLVSACREVSDGHVFYSKSVQQVLDRIRNDSDAYFRVLSKRELHILRAIAQQKSEKVIAEEYGLSSFTVRRHRHNAMQKLNLKNESAIIHFALEKGIVKHRSGLDWSE